MKILVTGRTGQLARCLAQIAWDAPGVEVVTVGRPQFDLLDAASIARTFLAVQPDLVVSAAAYTAVDKAESEEEEAFAVNATGAGLVAEAAFRHAIPIIHISTDYVFNGDKGAPYEERDPVDPLNVYGRTKLEGELRVASANDRHVILRTAWAYSPFGRNFVRTMLDLAANREHINVVADRFGSPTSMLDLGGAILAAARNLEPGKYGIYHLAGKGRTNWADLAREVMEASRELGGPHAEIVGIAASDYPTPAVRPVDSSLSCALFERKFGWIMPNWHHSVRNVVEQLV